MKSIFYTTACIAYVVVMLLYDGFVEAGCLLKFGFLHEENVGHVKFPDVALVAELDALSEDFLNLNTMCVN